MIRSKCPKCRENFVSKTLDNSNGFDPLSSFQRGYDWSTDTRLEEGYFIKCSHCEQKFTIKFDPVWE